MVENGKGELVNKVVAFYPYEFTAHERDCEVWRKQRYESYHRRFATRLFNDEIEGAA